MKDRVALQSETMSYMKFARLTGNATVIEDAEHQGLLHPHTGSRIFEGTVGSTGISLATVARAKYASRSILTLYP